MLPADCFGLRRYGLLDQEDGLAPFHETPEQIYGIKTPKDRVKEFRKLADRADSLSPTEQEQQVAALAQEFKDESDGWVRREILRALSQFPQPAAGAVLVDALYDGDTETRRVACRGLGIRGDEIAVRELVRVVNTDTETEVRMSAVRALGKTGDKTALAPWPKHWPTAILPCRPRPTWH